MKRGLARGIVAATAMVILLIAGWTVQRHEHTLQHGSVVLLELAPVDPRSLMQGDYMALSFAIDANLQDNEKDHSERYAHLRVDELGRATLASVSNQRADADDLVSVRLRRHGQRWSVGPDAFFFQEGQAHLFEPARWGEFHVAADGTALLTHLLDTSLTRLPHTLTE